MIWAQTQGTPRKKARGGSHASGHPERRPDAPGCPFRAPPSSPHGGGLRGDRRPPASRVSLPGARAQARLAGARSGPGAAAPALEGPLGQPPVPALSPLPAEAWARSGVPVSPPCPTAELGLSGAFSSVPHLTPTPSTPLVISLTNLNFVDVFECVFSGTLLSCHFRI